MVYNFFNTPMNVKFTQEDLIRFIYHETSATEENAILEQLGSDDGLLEEYRGLVKTISALDQAKLSPDPTSIRIIMEYSAGLQKVSG